MDEFTSGTPSKPARSRCQKLRNVILVICAALTLTSVAFVCAVAVVVAAVVHGFGSLFDGLFSGLFASFASLFDDGRGLPTPGISRAHGVAGTTLHGPGHSVRHAAGSIARLVLMRKTHQR